MNQPTIESSFAYSYYETLPTSGNIPEEAFHDLSVKNAYDLMWSLDILTSWLHIAKEYQEDSKTSNPFIHKIVYDLLESWIFDVTELGSNYDFKDMVQNLTERVAVNSHRMRTIYRQIYDYAESVKEQYLANSDDIYELADELYKIII